MPPRITTLARAVWETVHEQGVSAVSVRTVAARAGVAVGSLRHVFPTRAELLRYSGELVVAQVTQRVLAVDQTGGALEVALELLGAAPGAETAARAQRLQFFVDGLALHLVQRPAHEDPSWASALLRAELARAASEAASAR